MSRNATVLKRLADAGSAGLTCADIEAIEGWGHGSASAALSTLHQQGAIVRTSTKRAGQKIYLLGEYLREDQTSEAPRARRTGGLGTAGRETQRVQPGDAALDTLLREWLTRDARGSSRAGRRPMDFLLALRIHLGWP